MQLHGPTKPGNAYYFAPGPHRINCLHQSLASSKALFGASTRTLKHHISTGKPTETANISDGLALFEKVRTLHSEIAILGRSLGSGVAVQVASRVTVSRLILITPFDSIVEITAQMYPFLPVRWLAIDTYESGKFARGIKAPTTIIGAENDAVIPQASTEALLSRFDPGIATMTLIEGVGHNDLGRSTKYNQTLQAALK